MKQLQRSLGFCFMLLFLSWKVQAQSSVILPPDTVNPICLGIDNGSVSFQVAGTPADFFFSWSGGNLPTNGNPVSGDGLIAQTGLRAGDYFVFIQDNNTGFDTTIFISLKNQRTVVVSAGNDINNCLGQPVNLTATSNAIPGSIFQWFYTAASGAKTLTGQTATIPASPSPDAITISGPVGILVTDPAGCSAGNQINVTVNVPPVGFADPDTQTICQGLATITLGSNQPSTTYTWTVVRSGISGASPGSGAGISQNLRATTSAQGRVTYNIRPVSPVGCVGPVFTSVVFVNPKPQISAEPDTTEICSGESTNIVLSSSLNGTTFAWNAGGTQASGFSAGTGSVIAQTLEATTDLTGRVTYRVAGSANGCLSDSLSVLAFVKPVPVILVDPSDTVPLCPNQTQLINYSSNVAGAAISWTVQANGTGAVDGSGSSHNQTYLNPGNTILNADFSAIAVANGCTSLVKEHRVKVFPQPEIQAIAEKDSICSGDSVRIQLISSLPGTSFSWTSTAAGLTGNGSGSGSSIREMLLSTGLSTGTVTYTITGSTPDCPGVEITKTIFVKPRPVVSVSPERDSICSGSTQSIALSADIPGTVFSWTVLAGNVSGAAPGSGSSIVQQLALPAPGLDSVIYTVTGSFRSCPGPEKPAVILVQRSAPPVPSDPAPVVCSGTPVQVALSPAGTWNWILASGSAPGAASGSGTDFQQTPLNNGNADLTLNYLVFGTISQCPSDSLHLPVLVKPNPRLQVLLSSDSLCSGESLQADLSSQPADNVSFSWSVQSDNVNGAAPGNGSQLIQTLSLLSGNLGSVNYHFVSERAGCRDSLDKMVVVTIPVIPFNPDLADSLLCDGDSLRLLPSSALQGLEFSWTVNPVNVSGAAPGSGKEIRQALSLTDPLLGDGFVDYFLTPKNGTCIGASKTKRIFVSAFPEAPLVSVLSGSSPICPGDSLVLSSSAISENQWFRNAVPVPAPAGTARVFAAKDSGNYSVSFTSPEGCSSMSASVRLDVRELPVKPLINGPEGFCSGDSIVLHSNSASGNQWQLNGTDLPGAVDSVLTVYQPGIYSVRLTNSLCAVASSGFPVMEFSRPPAALISGPASFCADGSTTLLSSVSKGIQWFRNDTLLPGAVNPGLSVNLGGDYSVLVTDSNGCTTTSSPFSLLADVPPVASVISGPVSSCNGGSVVLTATANLNYQWLLNGQVINGETQQTLSASAFGDYRVIVTRGTCADTSAAFTLLQSPPDFSVDSLITSATCLGGIPADNGQISLSVQGGSGNFSFQWTPASLPSMPSQSGLAPGNYSVKITDAVSGCFLNKSYSIAPAPVILPGTSLVNDSRCDLDNGSISLSPAGSPGPFGYAWTGRPETSSSIQNLAAGTYEVTITDSTTGCIRLLSGLQIGGADTLNLSAILENQRCEGPGSIQLQTSGGSAQFSYHWGGTGSGLVAGAISQNNLSAGTYAVTVLDTLTRCARSLNNLEIQNLAIFDVQVQGSNPGFCHGSDGKAVAITGKAGAVYLWKNSAGLLVSSDSVLSGVAAGTYRVLAQKGLCLDSAEVTLTDPVLSLQVSAVQIAGCDSSNGSIALQVNNGGGNISYSWTKDGLPFSSAQNLSGLSGGDYMVLVDASGCRDSASVSILPAGSFSISGQVQPSASCLSADGSISLSIGGNAAGLHYQWTRLPAGTAQGGDSARLASISSGFYKVVVSNGNCSDSAQFLVPALNQTVLQDSIQLPGYCGASNGNIFILDSASFAGQSATWFRDGALAGSGFSLRNIPAGQYQFLLSNSLPGGPLPCDQLYTFNLPDATGLALSVATDSADCSNQQGSAIITSGSADPGLLYTWVKTGDPAFSASGASQTNLSSGIYRVFVTGTLCSDTIEFTVPKVSFCDTTCNLPVFVFEVQPSGCSSSDGALVATAIGLGPQAVFTWTSLPQGQVIGNDDTLKNIPAGLYKVTIVQNSCILSKEYLLKKSPVPFQISSLVNNASCANNDGKIEVLLNGASASATCRIFRRENGQLVSDSLLAIGLAAGTYRIEITDGSCLDSALAVVSKPLFCGPCNLQAQAASNPAFCPGVSDGRAFAIVTSGGTGPFRYILNGQDTLTQAQFLQIFPNQPAGTFSIEVLDLATQCSDTVSAVVGMQFSLSAAVTAQATDCDTSGRISVSLSGAPGPYTLILSGDTLISGNDTIRSSYSDTLLVQGPDAVFEGLPAGAYQLQVLSAQGCSTRVEGIRLNLRSPVFVKLGAIKAVSCAAANDGSITIDSLAGSDSYQYFLSGQSSSFQPLVAGTTLSGLAAGTYSLKITGNRSCELDTSFVIGGPEPLQLLMQAQAKSLCTDSAGSAKAIFLQGGNGGPYTFSLQKDGLNYLTDTLAADSVISGLAPGSYSMLLRDKNQCTATAVFVIDAIRLPYSLSISADTFRICSDDTLGFTASVSENIPGLVYNWYRNNVFFSNSGPVQKLSGLSNGDSVFVEVSPGAACYSPGTARSQAIRIQVTPSAGQVAAGLAGLDTLVCTGTSALLQAENLSQVPDVSYTWLVNGIEQPGQTSAFLSYQPQSPRDTVQVVLTALSGQHCLLKSTDSSDVRFVVQVSPAPVKDSLQLTAPAPGTFLCPGTPLAFSLGSSLQVPFTVEWFANGVKTGSTDSGSFTFQGLSGLVKIRAVVHFDTSLACLQGNGPAGTDSTAEVTVQFLQENDPRCLPCALNLTAEVQNLSCASSADGKITASVSGGTGAYRFSLSPGGPQNTASAVFSGLLPGVYMLTVRDTVTQCTDTLRGLNVVSQHNYAVSLAFENSSSCTDTADGRIEVLSVTDGSGDNGKYQFSLLPGHPEFGTQMVFENLLPDTFLLQVKDTISGCITSVSRIIRRKNPADAFLSLVNPVSCFGGADGRIRIDSIISGSGLYQVSSSGDPGSYVNVQPGDTLSGFSAGDAFLYIRDIKTGCVDSNFIFVPQPAVLSFTVSLTDSSSCISSTGKVKITSVSGGNLPYSYAVKYPDSTSFAALNFPADSSLSGIGEGWLKLLVNDAKGCSFLDSVFVPVNRPLIGNISLTSPCIGDSNGIIRLSGISGGNAPYTYSLINAFGQVIASQTDTVFSGLVPGAYKIAVKDASGAAGCENIYSRALQPTAPLRFRPVRFKESSCDYFDGEAVFVISGGQPPYRFSFDSLAGQFTAYRPVLNNDTLKLKGMSARIPGAFYTLRILDNGPDGGCSYDTNFVQPGQAPLQYQFSKKNVTCFGEASGSVRLSGIRGTGPLVIRVRRVGTEEVIAFDTLQGTFFQNSSFVLGGIPAGEFNLEVRQFGACTGSKSIPFTLTQPTQVQVHARMFRKSAEGFSLGSILMDSVTGGVSPYLVSFNEGAAFTYRADSMFRKLSPGNYLIRAVDDSGCVAETLVECEEDLAFFVPNLFTPNNDGVNDKLEIRNLPAGCRLVVKDRWGREVFRSDDYRNEWDGKGEDEGTYFWVLEIPNQDARSGWVNIER